MLIQRLLVCGLLLSAASASAYASQAVPAAPVGDIEPGIAWRLNNAGYVLTEESLIVALSDPDPSIVSAASVREKTGQPIDVVAELKEVLLDERAAP